MAAAAQEGELKGESATTTATTHATLEKAITGISATTITTTTNTTTTTTDPWMLFLYALKAPATKEKYIQRLIKFLDFLGYEGTKEEKASSFAAQAKADPVYGFNSLLKFFQSKREQIDRKEMAIGTFRNYLKSIKLFCDMAYVHVPWAKITRGLPRGKRFADICQVTRKK
jgi:hypothetical protein